jgi:1,4-alpha-glucan branching enzyme
MINRGAYSAHRNTRTLNFVCRAPEAKTVSLVGDFNHWNPSSNLMQRSADGSWNLRLELRHGHHRYAFSVDGTLTLDPMAMGITRDDHGQRVSLVAVS